MKHSVIPASTFRTLIKPALLLLALAITPFNNTYVHAAAMPVNVCVFDPLGQAGPIYQAFLDYKSEALKWNADLKLAVYPDESVAAAEFKAGRCDLVSLSDLTARNFNSFTGSVNSIGAIPTYKHLKIILDTLQSPKAAKYMRDGEYEIVSIIPGGAVFMFVNDKNINSVEKLAGKKLAVLDNAPEMQYLAQKVGMTPVGASYLDVFSKWNNGSVDAAAAPGIVYEPVEMKKGLGEDGGIIQWPLIQVTQQMVARWEKIPEGFGQASRDYSSKQFDYAINFITTQEKNIPEKYWVNIDAKIKDTWKETFRQSRLALRDRNIYNGKMLTLMRKVRCNLEPSATECSAEDKE